MIERGGRCESVRKKRLKIKRGGGEDFNGKRGAGDDEERVSTGPSKSEIT